MADLAKFLLARIAETESTARAFIATRDDWDRLLDSTDAAIVDEDMGSYRLSIRADHVLAECEAKRRIIEDERLRMSMLCQEGCYWTVLAYLALPYADHPDYRFAIEG